MMKKITFKKKFLLSCFLGFTGILEFLILSSTKLAVTQYTYSSERVPASFDGYKIVQLSDIHCKSFGKDNQKLIDEINALEPDLILITGDSVDSSHQDLSPLENLFRGISNTAPIYVISGNHEFEQDTPYEEFLTLCDTYGIHNLDNQKVTITEGNDAIQLVGIDALNMKAHWDFGFLTRDNPDMFSILLNHYPGQIVYLAQYGYDIILSGHMHGGIIRIPHFGGLIGNKRELFPKYDAGKFTAIDTTMYVSRGLGDARIPRINNRPEIVCITLRHVE